MFQRKFFLFVCLTVFVCIDSIAQISRAGYCSCVKAPLLNDESKYYQDSFYATYEEDATGIAVKLINTTVDTLYVFKSYIDRELLSSKYLHRVNTKERKYKLSLLPIVSNVFTKYADLISEERIAGNQQIVYDFIKLPPNSVEKVLFRYEDLFKNRGSRNSASKDFDVKQLHKYSKIPKQFCMVSSLKGNYEFEIEFAVYKSVSLLCKESAYFLQESEFDKQSKDFTILTVPVRMSNYDY